MRYHTPPLTQSHHPATFRSRGVAAPFTTPILAGARLRDAERGGVELVVANPSGGRGMRILPWLEVATLCRPTVHDSVLLRRLARRPAIDPASVRRAALEVAAEGFAGRAPIAAAARAIANDREERRLAEVRLTSRLAEYGGAGFGRASDHRRGADAVLPDAWIYSLAPSFGLPAARLTVGVRAIARAFAPLGIVPEDANGRIPRLIALLRATGGALSAWLAANDEPIGLGRSMTEAMQTAANGAQTVRLVAHATLADPATLLRRWVSHPGDVVASAARCDWLLDGWERVCLLWAIATSDASRRAAALEMAPLVPVLPQEVADWTDVIFPWQAMTEICRVIHRRANRPGAGATLAWIQRNEQLRAMSI